jgi:nicotinamidase-related amidase
VLQTALGLSAGGWRVTLVADAVASRRDEDRAQALAHAAAERLSVVTTEMLVFAWLGHADHPAFRPLIRGIKALA